MFPSPGSGQDMKHSSVEATGNADLETIVEGLAIEPVVSVDQEIIA